MEYLKGMDVFTSSLTYPLALKQYCYLCPLQHTFPFFLTP